MRKKGFSLLELIIVVGIVALLSATAVRYMKDYAHNARLTKVDSDMETIFLACHRLSQLEQKSSMTMSELLGRYLQDEAMDPWGNPYLISFGYIMCSGEDSLFGTEDDIKRHTKSFSSKELEVSSVAGGISGYAAQFEKSGTALTDMSTLQTWIRSPPKKDDSEIPTDPWNSLYEVDGDDIVSKGPDRVRSDDDIKVPFRDGIKIAVMDATSQSIKFLTEGGAVLKTIPTQGAGYIASVSSGDLYMSEMMSNRIRVFSGEGRAKSEIAVTRPRNIAVQDSGKLAVVAFDHQVLVFNGTSLLTTLGTVSFGTQPGRFSSPGGLAWDQDKLFIADTWNYRIQVFNSSYQVEKTFSGGKAARDVVVRSGKVYVSNQDRTLQIFTSEGQLILTMGTPSGSSAYYKLAVDRKGRIWTFGSTSSLDLEVWTEDGKLQKNLDISKSVGSLYNIIPIK